MKTRIATITFLIFTSLSHFSANAAAQKNTDGPTSEQVRCEKLMGVTLTEFKAALVENCNLDKPFSSSLSRILNEESYFYCCQKK